MVNDKGLYLLDTNTVTLVVTGRSAKARQTYREVLREERIAVSTITEAEILYGFAKKPEATRFRSYMEEFLKRTDCLAWNSASAQAFSVLRTKTEAVGLTLGAMDLLIAAHATALGATLVTHDRALHRAAKFISVVDWATDL